MKKTILILAVIFISSFAFSQDIKGIKIITAVPTQNELLPTANVIIKIKSLTYNVDTKRLEIETVAQLNDSTWINPTYPGNTVKLDSINYNLNTAFELINLYYNNSKDLITEKIR